MQISVDQANKFASVLSRLGVDPTTVLKPAEAEETVVSEQEVEQPAVSPEPVVKRKKSEKINVDISPETIQAAKKFFEIGKIGARWYYQAYDTLKTGFPDEQDRVLFALLLASTSVQNEVYQNFIEAALMFNAIKRDMIENRELLTAFVNDENLNLADPKLLSGSSYKDLHLFRDSMTAKVTQVGAKMGNIKRFVKLYLEGSLDKALVRTMIGQSVRPNQEMSFDRRDPLIRRLKIANFALTLVDPGFASTSRNPFNVVVDTWMFRIFYPEQTAKGQFAKGKAFIDKLFGSEVAYVNVSNAVSQLASEAGVSPHYMQAALWTGIKKTWEGDVANISNYVSAIDRMIKQYGEFWQGMEQDTKNLAAVISRITPTMAAKGIRDKRAERIRGIALANAARNRAEKERRIAAGEIPPPKPKRPRRAAPPVAQAPLPEQVTTHNTKKPLKKLRSVPASQQTVHFKPKGFWYSCGDSWKEWASLEMPEMLGKHDYNIKIDYSNIVRISNHGELEDFHEKYKSDHRMIDWSLVAQDSKGIEICPYIQSARLDSSIPWYYSWDVASGCIWDVSAIKGFTKEKTSPLTEQVRKKMNIPLPSDLLDISKMFRAAGKELHLVGGAVRDALMGKEPKDLDVATDATPDEVESILRQNPSFKILELGKAFGIVKVLTPEGNEFEIATFRRDIGKGRRPDSVEFTSIEQDVNRRDLTMNALFYDIERGEVVDYVGGIEDIQKGIVRTVGDPNERFDEDRLRILRALRFAGRLGTKLDPATTKAIRDNNSLAGVSMERVRDEFLKGIKSAKSVVYFLNLVSEFNLWEQIFPGLKVDVDFVETRDIPVQLALLLRDNDYKSIQRKLLDAKYVGNEIDQVSFLVAFQGLDLQNAFKLKSLFKRQVVKEGKPILSNDQLVQFAKFAGAPDPKLAMAFAEFEPAQLGDELMAKGFSGRELGMEIERLEKERFAKLLGM